METKKQFIYYRESWLQSIVADCFMFASLAAAMAMNYYYFGNSWFWGLVLFAMTLLAAGSRARNRAITFYSIEDLKKYVNSL